MLAAAVLAAAATLGNTSFLHVPRLAMLSVAPAVQAPTRALLDHLVALSVAQERFQAQLALRSVSHVLQAIHLMQGHRHAL